jgi:hypothetical protein
MTEPEGFLSRWARRKREAAETRAPQPGEAAPHDASREPAMPEAALENETVSVDLSALPSIESITATTDIRPFLAPGVPAELTRAALRRAWATDPAIRDFVGIAENQWDFTAENGVPGFGRIGSMEEVRRMVAELIGEGRDPAAETQNSPEPVTPASSVPPITRNENTTALSPRAEVPSGEAAAVDMQCSKRDVAMHDEERGRDAPTPGKRGHGGALPK